MGGGARARTPPFTLAWETVIWAATDAGLTRAELCVLLALMRWQGDGGELSRPAEEIAEECGLSLSTVRHALVSLTRKVFDGPRGPTPVISRVSAGHRGSAAAYMLNVPRKAWDDGG